MDTLIFLITFFFISTLIYFLIKKLQPHTDMDIFPMFASIISGSALLVITIIIPIQRTSVRSYYREYVEVKLSVENLSKTSGYEKAAIYNKVIDINREIEGHKYYAESPWFDIFYDEIIFKMKPIRIEK